MKEGPLLRDIHLPDGVSWWPPAPGWWVLLVVSLLATLAVWFFIRNKLKAEDHSISHAIRQLDKLVERKDITDEQLIRQLSKLLRRASMSLYGRKKIAGLAGEDWLAFLDSKWVANRSHSKKQKNKDASKPTAFQRGKGRVLLDQPYKKQTEYERSQLIKLVRQWLMEQGVGRV